MSDLEFYRTSCSVAHTYEKCRLLSRRVRITLIDVYFLCLSIAHMITYGFVSFTLCVQYTQPNHLS